MKLITAAVCAALLLSAGVSTIARAQDKSDESTIAQIEDLRAGTEKKLQEYDRSMAQRDDLTMQLQEAVGIDDKVLIERAVNDIEDNRSTLKSLGDQLEESRKQLMDDAGKALLAKQISRTMYVFQLDFGRQIEQVLKKPPSGLLLGLLIDAHNKANTSLVYKEDFVESKGGKTAAEVKPPQPLDNKQ